MRPLTSKRLVAQLESLVTDYAFNDKARYYPEPDLTALDDAGQPVPQINYENIQCSWNDSNANENWTSLGDVENIDAEIRVKGFTPNKGAYFELMARYDIDVSSPVKYEVVGRKDRGEFGYVCALKKVIL